MNVIDRVIRVAIASSDVWGFNFRVWALTWWFARIVLIVMRRCDIR
jgi:hypothetical protein